MHNILFEKLNYFTAVVQRWAHVKRSPGAIVPRGIGLGTSTLEYAIGGSTGVSEFREHIMLYPLGVQMNQVPCHHKSTFQLHIQNSKKGER